MLLAVAGGWLASVFTAFNTWLCLLRKKWSKFFSFRILEVMGNHCRRSIIMVVLCCRTGAMTKLFAGCLFQQPTPSEVWVEVCARLSCLMDLQDVSVLCCMHAQVCIISIITSIVLFALPLGGRCHSCDSGNPEHCVKSEGRAKSHHSVEQASAGLQSNPGPSCLTMTSDSCYVPHACNAT
jgi:hypothetical protein